MIRLFEVASVLVFGLELSGFLGGQGVTPQDSLYARARAHLVDGDTAQAVGVLEGLTESSQDFAPGFALLGEVLTAKAGYEAEGLTLRKRAERALRRALRLAPQNPRYLVALGRLMRKQGLHYDAHRLLRRGLEHERVEDLPADRIADAWFELGLFYEEEYLDTRGLVFTPNLPVQSPDCFGLGSFCLNFTRPKRFNAYFRSAGTFEDEAREDYERMVDAFRRALEADPTHTSAARRLVTHLVDQGNLREARRVAASLWRNSPRDPWAWLLTGLVRYETGQDSLAELAFQRGLGLADTGLLNRYRDIGPLLRKSEAEKFEAAGLTERNRTVELLWRKSDPLHLTRTNEVRVAHLARVTFADVMFEEFVGGTPGSTTERGRILIRYGKPKRVWLVPRDASKEPARNEAYSMPSTNLKLMPDVPGGQQTKDYSNFGFSGRTSAPRGGGRWIFWNYGWNLPNFIFEKQLRFRHARHMLSSHSKATEETLREKEPAVYEPKFEVLEYPVQIARFKGKRPGVVAVEYYGLAPADRLVSRPDSIDVGLFLFAEEDYAEVYEHTMRRLVEPKPARFTYSVGLPAGRYSYSLEARTPREPRVAVGRGTLLIEPFERGLEMSDLVLAHQVRPKTKRPRNRRQFAIEANVTGVVGPEDPLAVYWELYGLDRDEEGLARYRVEVEVSDASGRGVLSKVVGVLGQALGLSQDQKPLVSWERTVALQGDRTPEYLRLELPNAEPGSYRVTVRVADELSGQVSTSSRVFRVVSETQ